MKTVIAALLAAVVAVPAIAQEAAPAPRTATVYIDNRSVCFGGRTGEWARQQNEYVARKEAKRLRAEGVAVRIVKLNPGQEVSGPLSAARVFTSAC